MSSHVLTAPGRMASASTRATRILSHDETGHHGAALFQRYRRLFIGDSIVRGILALKRREHDPVARAQFARHRQAWKDCGGFIETITLENVVSWVRSNEYILAEAADLDSNEGWPFTPVAECVFRLSTDRWLVPRLVEPLDEIYDSKRYERIVEDGPQASAVIDFLGVLPELAGKGLAGSARYAGMLEIIAQNEKRPPEQRIRHILGMTFAVQGLEILNPEELATHGRFIWLSDLGQDEIINRASVEAISKSKRCPAYSIGRWAGALPVPVTDDGRSYRLHVHWYCNVRDTQDLCPEALV